MLATANTQIQHKSQLRQMKRTTETKNKITREKNNAQERCTRILWKMVLLFSIVHPFASFLILIWFWVESARDQHALMNAVSVGR